jgi:hypothetical protein
MKKVPTVISPKKPPSKAELKRLLNKMGDTVLHDLQSRGQDVGPEVADFVLDEIQKDFGQYSVRSLQKFKEKLSAHLEEAEKAQNDLQEETFAANFKIIEKPMKALLRRICAKEVPLTIKVQGKVKIGACAEFFKQDGETHINVEPAIVFDDLSFRKAYEAAVERTTKAPLKLFDAEVKKVATAVLDLLKQRPIGTHEIQALNDFLYEQDE